MKDEVLQRALALPPEEREEVAEMLFQSLMNEKGYYEEKSVEEAWGPELLKRLDDLKSGRVKGIDGWQMLREAEAEIAERTRKLKKKSRH